MCIYLNSIDASTAEDMQRRMVDLFAQPIFWYFFVCLKPYNDEIWYVGTLSDMEYDCLSRILLF